MSQAEHIADAIAQRHADWRKRMRETTVRLLKGFVPKDSAMSLAKTGEAVDDAHFHEAVCRNCGTVRSEPYCGACGQGSVSRFGIKDIFDEFWGAWRLFEMSIVHSTLRLAMAPGRVAREYVLGARKRHMHPLKLMLYAIGLLVVVLAKTQYLQGGSADLSAGGEDATLKPIMDDIAAWSRWSFSMTAPAIFLASWGVFRTRLGYNWVEHLVLTLYVQFLIIAMNVVVMLPLWWNHTPAAVAWHQHWTPWLTTPLEVAIVARAFWQFHYLSPRSRDLTRLAIALAIFVGAKKLLLFLYGRAILEYVLSAHS